MSVLSRYAWRSLRRNRARTAVCALGIALSCALITAILTSAVSLADALYRGTKSVEGSWEVQFNNLSEDGVAKLRADGRTADVVLVREYGVAQLPKLPGAVDDPSLLGVESVPSRASAHGIIIPPKIETGRMPESTHEILLPSSLRGEVFGSAESSAARSDGELAVGTTVTLPLGQRAVDDETAPQGVRVLGLNHEPLFDDKNHSIERIVNTRSESFTVVGFYQLDGFWSLPGGWHPALIGEAGDMAPTGTTAFVTTSGLSSYAELHAFEQLFADDFAGDADAADERAQAVAADQEDSTVADGISASLHLSLLRYRGITGAAAIWETVGVILAILSGVVVVASVSLVYTGFAISVAERTREYGLLSSLGASKRQLRRTLCSEAALYAAAGIPIGVLIGLAGTWVVFRLNGTALGMYLGNSALGVSVIISPWAIGTAIALSLLVIALSALLPALRAGRVSAVEALRSTPDVRPGRADRRRRRRARTVAPGRLSLLDGARLRFEGVPGYLAHRNLTRASGKSRVAVISLATSIALLVIAGSLASDMMLMSIGAADFDADIMVSCSQDARAGRDVDTILDAVDHLNQELSRVKGVKAQGTSTYLEFEARMPAGLLASRSGRRTSDGSSYATMQMCFLDDLSWKKYVRHLGLSEADYSDSEHPRAIALNRMIETGGASYRYRAPFSHVGTIELFTQLAQREKMSGPEPNIDAGGNACAVYLNDDGGREIRVPFEEAVRASERIEIGALAGSAPESLTYLSRSASPVLLLPLSVLRSMAQRIGEPSASGNSGSYLSDPLYFGAGDNRFIATLLYRAKDSARAAEAMRRIAADRPAGSGGTSIEVNDIASSMNVSRMIAGAAQTFTGAFATITGLIAVANVFNTLSASIILRRREFAVLRSIGMGRRAFLCMIIRECASYAARGLLIGLLFAGVVSYGLYLAMRISFAGISFELPVAWVAIGVGVALLVLVLSVVYALRRCRTDVVAEALRDDVM